MSLMRLPTEIELILLPMLDYASLMNFTATNRYYFSLRTAELIRQALLHFEEVCMKEWKSAHGRLPYNLAGVLRLPKTMVLWAPRLSWPVLPCYGCLRLVDASSHFIQKEQTSAKKLNGKSAAERRCQACRKPLLRQSRIAKARKSA
jgi:hypothetical protein